MKFGVAVGRGEGYLEVMGMAPFIVLLALTGTLLGWAGGSIPGQLGSAHPAVEAAWREARQRAGLPEGSGLTLSAEGSPPERRGLTPEVSVSPPEVVLGSPAWDFWTCSGGGSEASRAQARYLPDLDRVEILSTCARPLHALLVHEFLHAIRERARRASAGDLHGYDPGAERWVQERARGRLRAASSASEPQGRPDRAARSSQPASPPDTNLR